MAVDHNASWLLMKFFQRGILQTTIWAANNDSHLYDLWLEQWFEKKHLQQWLQVFFLRFMNLPIGLIYGAIQVNFILIIICNFVQIVIVCTWHHELGWDQFQNTSNLDSLNCPKSWLGQRLFRWAWHASCWEGCLWIFPENFCPKTSNLAMNLFVLKLSICHGLWVIYNIR